MGSPLTSTHTFPVPLRIWTRFRESDGFSTIHRWLATLQSHVFMIAALVSLDAWRQRPWGDLVLSCTWPGKVGTVSTVHCW